MKQNLLIPGAIVIAGLLVAGSLFFVNQDTQKISDTRTQNNTNNIPEVTESDHIIGNPNADIIVVEYSDLECPFCKRFHVTMKQIIDEYGKDGKVAWVYRHFPLQSLHPRNAQRASVASECAWELGGNDGFWGFVDRYYELTPSNDQTDFETVVPKIVEELGLDKSKFDSCLSENRYDEKVTNDFNGAVASGGRGTPYNVLISKNGNQAKVPGAQPIEAMRGIINSILSQ